MPIRVLTTLGLALLAGLASARAAQLTLNPVQDVLVASTGINAEATNLGVSNRGEAYIRRTLLQFDLSVLPAGAVIEKAVLRLIPSGVFGKEGGPIPITLWGLTENASWHEDVVTWETAPGRRALLEQGYGEPGLERLVSLEFDAAADLSKRPPIPWESDAFTAYIRRFAGKPVTLLVASEGGPHTPGLIFFSKDNRPVAKAVYPALVVTIK